MKNSQQLLSTVLQLNRLLSYAFLVDMSVWVAGVGEILMNPITAPPPSEESDHILYYQVCYEAGQTVQFSSLKVMEILKVIHPSINEPTVTIMYYKVAGYTLPPKEIHLHTQKT